MKPEVVLEILESAAEQCKVRVSYELLQTSVVHGGLCRVKGEYRIIIDKRASAEERVTTLATALAKLIRADGTSAELSPKVQELVRMHDTAPVNRAAAGHAPAEPPRQGRSGRAGQARQGRTGAAPRRTAA
jgi:hypothetical protein